jgi:hypothetical protein
MNFSFLHPQKKKLKDQSVEQLLVSMHPLLHDLSEGGEFLDDALRMEDLPRAHIEESIAAGSPENLL